MNQISINMKKNVMLLILVFSCIGMNAQEAVNASGGNASGNEGSISYTAGQPVYTAYSGTTGSVAQGVQQAFAITVVNAIDDTEDIALELSAYPNPVTDILILKTGDAVSSAFAYQLFDISGRLLQNNQVQKNAAKINMGSLPPATYLLKVMRNNTTVKTFQIIKK